MCYRCDVRRVGRMARLLNLSIAACPFPVTSTPAVLWVQGYVQEEEDMDEVVHALHRQSKREKAQ